MNNGNGKPDGKAESDFLGEGFHVIDKKIVSKTPPRIKWGEKYERKTDAEKIEYLEKLASAMNHAAFLIQGERDQLLTLCDQKEKKIESMAKALNENNVMIQQEITRMNADRQSYNQAFADMRAKLKEYENGNIGRLGS